MANNIQTVKKLIESADAILIGAGAGFAAAGGTTYGGERFFKNFPDIAEKYGLDHMYAAAVYQYPTQEEYWGYMSRHIKLNRYTDTPDQPYHDLLKLLENKNYFVLTTNVDHRFQKAGFDKSRLFYTQGDYGNFQCSIPCRQEVFDNRELIEAMASSVKDTKIPSELLPKCPWCGAPATANLRVDETFVQDAGWDAAADNYSNFVEKYADAENLLLIELGVGYNTPTIIKYAFWKLTYRNKNAAFVTMNWEDVRVPAEIKGQTIAFEGDIKATMENLVKA